MMLLQQDPPFFSFHLIIILHHVTRNRSEFEGSSMIRLHVCPGLNANTVYILVLHTCYGWSSFQLSVLKLKPIESNCSGQSQITTVIDNTMSQSKVNVAEAKYMKTSANKSQLVWVYV